MDYSAPPQEYPLDLAAFDLSDYVQNSSQELGDIFSGTGPAQQTQHHGQQHQQARDNQQQHATQSRSQQGHHYQSQPPLAQYPAQSQSQQQQQQQQQQPLSDAQQIQQLLGMQLQHQPQQQQQQQQSADLGLASITPAILRERLEQHMKIQQLQQLQAQILQQQIEMLRASQDPTHMPRRDVSYQGLPTPAASSELLPTMQNDVLSMSPIVLQGMLMNSATASSSGNLPDNMMPRMDLQNIQQHLTMSAPPSLAFQQTSPAITDYELSPLTSPWLSGTPGVPAGPSQHQTPTLQHAKRTRRNSDADDNGARKRQNAMGTRPMVVAAPSPPKRRTPPMRSVAHRRSSLANETMLPTSGEPSHQMLPPPPKDHASSSSSPSGEPSKGFAGSPDIAPVTPGAIMGLGPMRSGLVPPVTESGRPRRNTTKSRTQPEVGSSRKTSTTPLMGPSTPRTILPSGGTPILAPLTQGQPQVRKSSHKVAEQRRRDSMKLSYDDLRLLLPPIPVAADDAARDEPLLPGAMPPRGPPRGDGDGPNRAVSKLALLRSGNEYIRELKWKMDRRDEEVGRLRDEVGRLRRLFDKMGVRDEEEGMEPIDLARDLDEGWEEVRRARRAAVRAAMGDDEYDDDD